MSNFENLDLPLRVRVIQSIYDLYRNLFAVNSLGTSSGMLWDSLAYDINPMKRIDPDGNAEHRAIQQAMFETLQKILRLESEDCQVSALHGLNHVFHPDTPQVVEAFIRSKPDLDDKWKEIARACARGEAM